MEKLYLSQKIVEGILEHARATLPNECVGLLFGKGEKAKRRVPLMNIADVTTRYFAAPTELLAALREADRRGDDLLAIYHSHPNGRQTPSEVDMKEVRYDAVHLIAVPQLGILRGFMLGEGVREVDLIFRTATLEENCEEITQ